MRDWSAHLGPRDAGSGHVYCLAVCPDGSAYLSDGAGRLIRTGMNGTLLWDSASQAVVYLPENPYVSSEYTPQGQILGEFTRENSGFEPVQVDKGSGQPLPNDRLVRAVTLADGNLLTQVVTHRAIGPMTVSSLTYMEVTDKQLRPLGRVVESDAPGHLWGSDAAGNAYFTAISPTDGMNVVKAHIARIEP